MILFIVIAIRKIRSKRLNSCSALCTWHDLSLYSWNKPYLRGKGRCFKFLKKLIIRIFSNKALLQLPSAFNTERHNNFQRKTAYLFSTSTLLLTQNFVYSIILVPFSALWCVLSLFRY